MKIVTEKMLAECDGKEGRPIHIAHKGIVYDVSGSKLWRNGQHMKRHYAGRDLTADIQAAPHQSNLLERYPQVGKLKKEETESRQMPEWLAMVLSTNPFFRRHPHPMTVHFPIALMLANPLFNFLFLVTDNSAFETTAFHCLACGIISMIVAMATGFFTWWYNYMAKIMPAVAAKITLSIATLMAGAVLFIWRCNFPAVISTDKPNIFYLLLSFSFVPFISVIGWFGATLTFPIKKD